MLMRVWLWWDGSLTVPDRPRGHPNFPREGLLRYADDPDPRMRRLALDDPDFTPEPVERLSRDRSEEVRHRAATDPRLPATPTSRSGSSPGLRRMVERIGQASPPATASGLQPSHPQTRHRR